MKLAFEIEKATNEAIAFSSLLTATTEALYNSGFGAEDYEEAFHFLCTMATDHSGHLKTIKEKAFKLLREEKEAAV